MSDGTPVCESLEGRSLLSVSLVNGVLRVDGAASLPNTIVVGNNEAGDKVDVAITVNGPKGEKTLTAAFAKEQVKRVSIRGGFRADTIRIDQEHSPFAIPTRIEGRSGHDTILAGDEKDVIGGGAGNDLIDAGRGNDAVYGGLGDDTLLGGEGNDLLLGGLGSDSVDGGAGDDRLGGVLGENTLMGGEGRDLFLVRSLERNPVNDFDAATDVLKIVTPAGDLNNPPAE